MRKLAREYAFKLIFEFLFLKEYNEETLLNFLEDTSLNDSDRDYLKEVYFGATRGFDEVYQKLESHLENFRSDRLFKPDLAALILAVYEIIARPDIPEAVSVNEAIEIAKRYGTEKSPGFVNGILSSVLKGVPAKDCLPSAESVEAEVNAEKVELDVASAEKQELCAEDCSECLNAEDLCAEKDLEDFQEDCEPVLAIGNGDEDVCKMH